MARPKDPKTSTVTDESGLPRRDFLRVSARGRIDEDAPGRRQGELLRDQLAQA